MEASPLVPHPHKIVSDVYVADSPSEGIKPFLKKDRDHPFFIVPVVSNPLFPQFKGTKSLGAVRVRGQRGTCSAYFIPRLHQDLTDFFHRTYVVESK